MNLNLKYKTTAWLVITRKIHRIIQSQIKLKFFQIKENIE